jgi:hypothetical protein
VIVAVCALIATSCAPARETDRPQRSERFEGVIERVAGEPVFQAELDRLVASGLAEPVARERLRVHALLASEARRVTPTPERTLELVRKRAAVQLYLRDLRATTELPSEALVRERYEATGESRPFDEVSGELHESILNERTFARVVERVAAAGEMYGPEVMPELLPSDGDSGFEGGTP